MPIGVRYGIPMNEFYKLNPKKIQRYQPYMMAMQKKTKDDFSEAGWTNGIYVSRALGAALSKKNKYPQEPLALYQDPNAEDTGFTDADRFSAWAIAFNATMGDKEPDTTVDTTGDTTVGTTVNVNTDVNE